MSLKKRQENLAFFHFALDPRLTRDCILFFEGLQTTSKRRRPVLKIGEFSYLSQVTIHTLRHYDQIGLLKPVHIDSDTGYRYYELDQLPRLNRILALKDLGLPLDQIGQILNEPLSSEKIRGMLELKQAELRNQMQNIHDRLAHVETRLRQIEMEGKMPEHEVILKTVDPIRVAYARENLPTWNVAPEAEQKWLEFLGLRPYHQDADIVRAFDRLIHTPEAFKTTLIDTLNILWETSLEDAWNQAYPLLQASLDEKRRLFETYSLSEFLERALEADKTVTMKVDEEDQTLVCCKGHIRVPFQNLGNFYLMPSVFNSMRFWTFYESSDYTTIFLPYFEPSVMLDGDELAFESGPEHYEPSRLPIPTMNPALVFKALGDNTRYAIISHIAQSPRTAAELSKILKVSKPTISHHVSLLREAGLLSEKPEARSVQLSLKREIIESLSEATVGRLFNGR